MSWLSYGDAAAEPWPCIHHTLDRGTQEFLCKIQCSSLVNFSNVARASRRFQRSVTHTLARRLLL